MVSSCVHLAFIVLLKLLVSRVYSVFLLCFYRVLVVIASLRNKYFLYLFSFLLRRILLELMLLMDLQTV
jgi:hypothetical protein